MRGPAVPGLTACPSVHPARRFLARYDDRNLQDLTPHDEAPVAEWCRFYDALTAELGEPFIGAMLAVMLEAQQRGDDPDGPIEEFVRAAPLRMGSDAWTQGSAGATAGEGSHASVLHPVYALICATSSRMRSFSVL